MSFRVSIDGDNIRVWLQNIVDQEKTNLKDDYQSFVKPRTPIDTGRARRGWRQRQSSIRNEVPYIVRLEEGYSRQSPNGFVQQALSETIRKSNQRKY